VIIEALKQLESAEAQMLSLSQLSTDAVFQPRIERIVPIRDQARVEKGSAAQIDSLRLKLESSQQEELDPIWAIEIAGSGRDKMPDGLYIVDGHHRLAAYKLAKRAAIPVCICSTDFRTAVLVSKLVNCKDRALEMHAEQKRDAAWQYLAAMTLQGAIELPKGQSQRTIAGRFGVTKNTVGRMLQRMKDVDVRDYSDVALDPGTGYPRWRWVREHNSPWKHALAAIDGEAKTQRKAEKLARTVVALREDYSHEECMLAFEMLKAEDEHAAHQTGEGVVDLFAQIVKPQGLDIDYLLSL
jgi:ParB-like chromosome segregation protein Spo0J